MRQLKTFFTAKTVAVVGASSNERKVGYSILKNLIDFGFEGEIIPINLRETEILGLKCYPSILDVKQNIDLAVFVVPAKVCLQVAKECGERGIKNITTPRRMAWKPVLMASAPANPAATIAATATGGVMNEIIPQ